MARLIIKVFLEGFTAKPNMVTQSLDTTFSRQPDHKGHREARFSPGRVMNDDAMLIRQGQQKVSR
jgi:hypothetical protein